MPSRPNIARKRNNELPATTRLDRAGAVRTGLAVAAISGLFLVAGLAVHLAGDPTGLIITYFLLFWGASGAALGIGFLLFGGRR